MTERESGGASRENAELRRRLEEAEETLRAITSGGVDALVVKTGRGEQVFTLQGADSVYRTAIENINEGAITLSPEGTILYSNRYFASMVHSDLNRVIGASIFDFVSPENRGKLTNIMGRDSGRDEISLCAADGAQVPVYIAIRKLRLDKLFSICAIVTDLTEQKRSQELIRTGRMIQSILEQSPNPVIVTDAAGIIIYASEAAHELCRCNLFGEPVDTPLALIHVSGRPLSFADIRCGEFKDATCTRENGETLYFLLRYGSFGSAGESQGYVISLTDITLLKRAEEELDRHRERLEELVQERTREIRALAHRLVDAQEHERTLIGNELHDEIGQYLTYTTLLIDKAARKPDQFKLAEARSTIQETISRIRNLSSMLSPRLLRSSGLLPALASHATEYTERTNIKVHLNHNGRLEQIPEDIALAVYRIVQESLTNVARHAKAREVRVRVSREPDRIHLEVADNGVGFDSGSVKKSTGMTGMKERALALGGQLNIHSVKGQGTTVAAWIPLTERQSE